MSAPAPSRVDDELDRFVDDGQRQSNRLSVDFQELWAGLARSTRSGKRFRSRLLLAAHAAYAGQAGHSGHGGQAGHGSDKVSDKVSDQGSDQGSGTDETGSLEAAARVAAAVELLHAAFVVHDDVIDRDLTRRGEPNVSGAFVERARQRGARADGCATLGLAAGVLAGDLLLVGATREIALCGADAATTRSLLDLLSDAVAISAAGELDDVAMGVGARAETSLGEIITAAEHKTAVYSFRLPLQAGAVLAGAPPETVRLLGTVGRLAGIGFQLVDDLRGVFADESETGKSALGDLREGKLTALVAHARGTDAWPEISRYVGRPDLDEDGAGEARRLLAECGSRAFVEQLADDYLTAALATAEDAGLADDLVSELAELCHRILRSAA